MSEREKREWERRGIAARLRAEYIWVMNLRGSVSFKRVMPPGIVRQLPIDGGPGKRAPIGARQLPIDGGGGVRQPPITEGGKRAPLGVREVPATEGGGKRVPLDVLHIPATEWGG